MKKIFIPLIASMFFFSTCAKEDENDPENASVSLSDNATTFSVTVSSGKYYLDGSSNPSLKLKRGYVYYFDAIDSSTNTHPLLYPPVPVEVTPMANTPMGSRTAKPKMEL